MTLSNFSTSNQTFHKLMGNGLIYRVPMFQRDYSWTEEEWEDLWQDLVAMLEPGGEPAHYMGYLVLQTQDDRVFEVIDGQQRLTTLSLLVLAVLRNLKHLVASKIDEHDNQRRIDELRKTYVGFVDAVTLVSKPKLTLNRDNNDFYQNYLVPLENPPKRNLTPSQNLLRKCSEWYEEKVRRRFEPLQSGRELALFIDQLTNRLLFTVITVTDELNAFKVFETLNARGVRLSSTDLLKNYLFSIVHKDGRNADELRALEERWDLILGKLGTESFPDFLRVFWNSRHSLTRHSELFKTIKSRISSKADVFELVRDMDRDADLYASLTDPHDSGWNQEQKTAIGQLSMFNVRQQLPLLLASRRALVEEDFTRVLRACVIIAFRYNVIGNLATNDQERVYNDVAKKIASEQLARVHDIITALRPIYVGDAAFKSAFAEKQFRTKLSRNKQVVRYILFELERQSSGHDFDDSSDTYNIEHVLPENPDDSWNEFTDEQLDRFTFRLGNMTLLKVSSNQKLGNHSFELKRQLYEASEFRLTRDIAQHHQKWNPERVNNRQQSLAKLALTRWRIAELSQE